MDDAVAAAHWYRDLAQTDRRARMSRGGAATAGPLHHAGGRATASVHDRLAVSPKRVGAVYSRGVQRRTPVPAAYQVRAISNTSQISRHR